jgi:alpha-1,2-mannosyltransferase
MMSPSASRERAVLPLTAFAFWLLSAAAWGCVAFYFGTAHGHLDFGRHAVGRDFVIIWTAAHLAAEGRVLDVFQPQLFLAGAHRLFDPALPYHFWSYPPTALLNVLWLGRLDYFTAYVAWCGAGLAALFFAARAFLRERLDLGLLMLSPAVATNLVLGQNGFITAALLLGGFALLERRPMVAGGLFGLLGFKPQLGFLLPVALAADRRWRPFAAAAAVGLLVAALSVAVFGPEAWRAFLEFTVPAQRQMMVGTGPFRWMTPSAFMSGLIVTGSPTGALVFQAPFSLLGIVLAWRAFRTEGDLQLRAAAVMVATFIASPQSFNYDMIPVAAAALVMVRRSPTLTTQLLAAILWIGPLLVMPLNAAGVPVMPLFLAAAGLQLDRILTAQRNAGSEARHGIERQNA